MKKIGPFLRTIISLLLIILLFYIMRGKYDDIIRVLKSTSMMVFFFAFSMFMAASSLATFRMKLIIEAQGIKITFREVLSLTFIGYFFNNFLPTAIGGDVVKAHYLYKYSSDRVGSYASVFIDRIAGLITMIFMSFTAMIFVGAEIVDKRLATAIYVITAVAALGIFFLSNKTFAKRFSALVLLVRPIEGQLRNLYTAVSKYHDQKKMMIGVFFISILSQLCYYICYGILARSIGSVISITDLLIRMPLVGVISLLPSINGLGVREGSVVMLFGPLVGKENALAISILMIMLLLIVSAIGGLVYALSPQFKMKLSEIKKESVKP